MCGRLSLTASIGAIVQLFLVISAPPELRPRWNAAPGQKIPCVIQGAEGRSLVEMGWGLVPAWGPDIRPQITARGETAAAKPFFRSAFARRRLLVPASGFYEWRRSGKSRTPYHFHFDDGRMLAIAGLWEEGEAGSGMAVLTVAANALMAPIHDRMPAILPPSSWERWLDPAQDDKAGLASLLAPWPGGDLVADEVGPLVNDWRNDEPACASPLPRLL